MTRFAEDDRAQAGGRHRRRRRLAHRHRQGALLGSPPRGPLGRSADRALRYHGVPGQDRRRGAGFRRLRPSSTRRWTKRMDRYAQYGAAAADTGPGGLRVSGGGGSLRGRGAHRFRGRRSGHLLRADRRSTEQGTHPGQPVLHPHDDPQHGLGHAAPSFWGSRGR